MGNYTMRKAVPADLQNIAGVEALCFPAAEAATEESFRKRLAVYPEHFYLLFDGKRLVSFVDGFVTDLPDLTDEMYDDAGMHNEDGRWQMVFGVNTIPEYRRQGCAGALLRKMISDAREQGRLGLVLTCKEHMLRYYSSFGFVNEGISVNSVHGGVRWYQMRLTF